MIAFNETYSVFDLRRLATDKGLRSDGKWKVDFLFNYQGNIYRATAVTDTEYHLSEAICHDKRFEKFPLEHWRHVRIIDVFSVEKHYKLYKLELLSVEKQSDVVAKTWRYV